MDIQKECVTCHEEKVASPNSKISDFYKTKTGYRGSCKVCYREKQKQRDDKIAFAKKANSHISCPSIDGMFSSIIGRLDQGGITMEDEEMDQCFTILRELKNQKKVEEKTTHDQSMHFSKKELGYKLNDIHNYYIRNAVKHNIPGDIGIINDDDLYIFDRLDVIKIILDKEGVVFTDNERLSIKTMIIEQISNINE